MNQVALIQSGVQQWIRQPAAIHQSQFAVCSSLAVYIHASDDYRLVKILAQHSQHLQAICWSPVDAKLLACATSEQAIKVYNLENDSVVYQCAVPVSEPVKKLCWSTHDENVLLATVGSTVGCWPYKQGGWQVLYSFKAAVTCMQQSASETRLLAVGCADCSLHMFDLLVNKVVCTVRLDEGVVPCDVQFDPLSKQYLVLLCRNGSISMYGVSEDQHALQQVFSLAKQPAAERSAAFVPNEPGNFISISNKTGVLQLWNVSQQQPLKNIKTGKGPAQSVQFFPGTSKALLTFQDGTVMVYNVCSQEPLWSTQPGHTETIFDCCFHPQNPQLLATCSWDGSVRVWDVGSGACVKTMDLPGSNTSSTGGQKQSIALYSVAWSPDGSQLAASSNQGAVYLYNYAKGIAVKKWQLHTKMSLKVAWHPTEPNLLASSSMDGSVVAFKTDGTKVKVLRHSSATSGCAWHPTITFQLATTSEAGPVYIWDLNKPGDSCLLQTLNGHGKRSFSVAWSPLLPDMLLSGSDDATARVWDVGSGMCVALLLGHKTEVRALCWHPEVPWLVFTGSWDATIRVWDIRTRTCLHVCSHHHGDVYGLSIHSACPWVMVSASRDTTLRLWDLKGLAAGVMPRCFLEGALPRGEVEQYAAHSAPLLCGPTSQQLADWCSSHIKAHSSSSSSSSSSCQLSSLGVAVRVEVCQKLSAYFSAPGPAQTLWQLAAATAAHLSGMQSTVSNAAAADTNAVSPVSAALARCGSGTGLYCAAAGGGSAIRPLPAGESYGFQHMAAAKSALVSAANQLELSVRGRGLGKAAMGASRKEEVLAEAAMLHLQAGSIEHCCDLLVEAGEWDKALALAPAVSQDYWGKLLQRKADAAAKAGASVQELLPLMLATGQTAALTELLLSQKQYSLAASVAAVQACGGYQHFSTVSHRPGNHLQLDAMAAAAAVTSPTRSTAAAAAATSAALGRSCSLSPLGASTAPQLLAPADSSSLMMRRNSLPPLRGIAGNAGSASVKGAGALSPGAATAMQRSASGAGLAAAAGAQQFSPTGAAPPDRSWSMEGASSPGATAAAAAVVVDSRQGQSDIGGDKCTSSYCGAGVGSPIEPGLLQGAGSLARMRSSSGVLGGPAAGAVLDSVALAQLASVRQAQALAYRRQGQPLLAACAAITVNDVAGAITALHLGHEPEQAAMLALALGQLGGVDLGLVDRVYGALAIKCEAAGDWDAAAAAIKLLSKDVQHHLQLLVARSECSSKSHNAEGQQAEAGAAAEPVVSGLRQRLGIKSAAHYASLAGAVADPLESVRCLLLAGDHTRAAAKASTHLQTLLEQLQQQVILGPATASSSSTSQQQETALHQLPQVQQLLLWQGCVSSLEPSALVLPCWQEMFAYNLLAGALRAFMHGYSKVGSFLMSSLRRWVEQHQVAFPLCRAALLVLEAEALAPASPEAACSLLIAAADGPDGPDSIKSAARQKLQSYPRPAAAAASASGEGSAEAACVMAAGSTLPCRGPGGASCRSVVSARQIEGPWRVLDDGSSIVSLSEAVMLSHVMGCGPSGTGKMLRL